MAVDSKASAGVDSKAGAFDPFNAKSVSLAERTRVKLYLPGLNGSLWQDPDVPSKEEKGKATAGAASGDAANKAHRKVVKARMVAKAAPVEPPVSVAVEEVTAIAAEDDCADSGDEDGDTTGDVSERARLPRQSTPGRPDMHARGKSDGRVPIWERPPAVREARDAIPAPLLRALKAIPARTFGLVPGHWDGNAPPVILAQPAEPAPAAEQYLPDWLKAGIAEQQLQQQQQQQQQQLAVQQAAMATALLQPQQVGRVDGTWGGPPIRAPRVSIADQQHQQQLQQQQLQATAMQQLANALMLLPERSDGSVGRARGESGSGLHPPPPLQLQHMASLLMPQQAPRADGSRGGTPVRSPSSSVVGEGRPPPMGSPRGQDAAMDRLRLSLRSSGAANAADSLRLGSPPSRLQQRLHLAQRHSLDVSSDVLHLQLQQASPAALLTPFPLSRSDVTPDAILQAALASQPRSPPGRISSSGALASAAAPAAIARVNSPTRQLSPLAPAARNGRTSSVPSRLLEPPSPSKQSVGSRALGSSLGNGLGSGLAMVPPQAVKAAAVLKLLRMS